jgi:hypothetical protein
MSGVSETLSANGGFVLLQPTIVGRGMYAGRGVVAPNSGHPGEADDRGYLPVERWLASVVIALNDKPRAEEGLSRVCLADGSTRLLSEMQGELLGAHARCWPLIKLLDIGGPKVNAFGHWETPPIPCHVHSGACGLDGRLCGGGKLEAYFFPPSPVALEPDVHCRLGLKPGTTVEQVVAAVDRFGLGDDMYALCNAYPVRAGEGWTIRPGVVHSPAPWPTLELQLPQDDFNLLAYKLGQRLPSDEERASWKNAVVFKGLRDARDVVEQAVDMGLSGAPDFEARFKRREKLLSQGEWGSEHQIFFDEFFAKSFSVRAGKAHTLREDRPCCVFVWSGSGTANAVKVGRFAELLAVAGSEVRFESGQEGMLFYAFFPFAPNK